MRNKTSPGEYLAFLSTKYEVDADSLFHALISAEENRKSKCGNLSIECRGKQRNKIILLITKDSKVVAQFPVSREFLLEQNNPIKDAQKADVLCRHLIKKDREPHSFQIKDLRIGMKKVSLKAEVIEIAKPMLVFTRFGNYATVTNALIADKTGQIKLCLWNEQIDSISIGETIQIENASISTFRGERQLRIGKKGILHSVESMIAK
jgi:replication factor A1